MTKRQRERAERAPRSGSPDLARSMATVRAKTGSPAAEPPSSPEPPKKGRGVGGRVLVAGVLAGGVAAAIVAEKVLVKRAKAKPDPDRGIRFAERPGRSSTVTSFDGTELAVNVVGPEDGPTLVFAHGFTLDMTSWYFQWKRFAERYRCVLYDQRGHGRSAHAAAGDYSLQAVGRDLKAVLDAEGGDGPVIVLGHSMGGMALLAFAEEFADEFGSRVAGVVLASTAAGDLLKAIVGSLGARLSAWVLPLIATLTANPRRAARIRARALRGSDFAFLVARLTNFGVDASPSVVAYVVSVAARTPVEVWADLVPSLVSLDLGDAVASVSVPALVVVGDIDRLTPQASATLIADALPDGRLVVMEGAGHCAMLERHRQFNDVVGAFFEEVLAAREESAPRTAGSRA